MKQLDLSALSTQLSEWKMNAVIVMQGEQVVQEWYDRGHDYIGPLYSCTKSVLSALIGIALDKGYLQSVDQPMTDYVTHPEISGKSFDHIRIKHLLSMTPGFDWPDFDKPYKALRASNDPIEFVLKQALIHEPGESFTYNSGGSHLLSHILTEATGVSALEFAKEHLFRPLQFLTARWSQREGVNEGGTGLYLYGRDLVKLGVLYLQNGQWSNDQLLSADWIKQSSKLHHKGLLHYEPPIYGGYGFHWWISPMSSNGQVDCYFAFGHGGQYLMVVPELELVIVIRKHITKRNDAIFSRRLIFEHILPAFQ